VTAGADDCIASNHLGSGNGIPTTTFGTGQGSVTTSAEVLPDQMRSFLSGRSSELNVTFQDTYTIHGALAGPFDITVELNAEGVMRPLDSGVIGHPFRYTMVGTVAGVEIGTFNPAAVDIPESQRVSAFFGSPNAERSFSGPTQGSTSPFSVPFDITASHTFANVLVGNSFTIAFGLRSFVSVGQVDMLNTAGISFILPDGVFLTSALGGEFGVQAEAVPLPAALPLFAGGLALIGFLARRRKQKAEALA
jgi:hypothetical protein